MTEEERYEIATLASDLYAARQQVNAAEARFAAAANDGGLDAMKLFIDLEVARAEALCAEEHLTRAQREIAAAQPGVGVYVRAALQGQGRWAPDGAAG